MHYVEAVRTLAADFVSSAPVCLSRYRGTSLIRNCLLLGPYSRPMTRALR